MLFGDSPRFARSIGRWRDAARLFDLAKAEVPHPLNFIPLARSVLEAVNATIEILGSEIKETKPRDDLARTWYARLEAERNSPQNSGLAWLWEVRVANAHRYPSPIAASISMEGTIAMRPPDGRTRPEWGPLGFRWIRQNEDGTVTSRYATEFDSQVRAKYWLRDPPPPRPLMFDGQEVTGLDLLPILAIYVEYGMRRVKEANDLARTGFRGLDKRSDGRAP